MYKTRIAISFSSYYTVVGRWLRIDTKRFKITKIKKIEIQIYIV